MAKEGWELTDEQWARIEPLLPKPKPSKRGGRPRTGNRACFEGILWVLRSGARWKDMPDRFSSSATCWRRLRDWEEADVWLTIWRKFLGDLDAAGRLDWEEFFVDASFAPAKRGGSASAPPNAGKVRSGWWWEAARVCLWEFTSTRPRRQR